MDKLPDFNIENICRACFLNVSDTKTMISTDSNSSECLLDMFAALLHVEIESVKTLSTQICNSCETRLKLSYNFQQQCRESSTKFEEYLKVKKEKIEPVKLLNSNVELSNSEEKCLSEINNSKIYLAPKVRLAQFSHNEVARAIKEVRKNFHKNIECFECGFIGSNSRSLSIHILHRHKEIKSRWCAECNKEYDDLPEHLKNHENSGLQCRLCKKMSSTKSHLIDHLKGHSVTKRFNCEICRKSFISARGLTVHLEKHSNEKPYKCSFCTKAFSQIKLLKNHLKNLHESFKCNFCAQKFDKNHLLKVHLKEHSNLDNFCVECNVVKEIDCEHVCANKDEVNEADVKENPIETITENVLLFSRNFCTICNRKVKSLSNHTEKFHTTSKSDPVSGIHVRDENERKLLCTICGKQFNAVYKLRIHMRTHTGDLPYQCSFCSKRMNTHSTLVTHERTHTGEKPHICHVCGKGFSLANALNNHMKLHNGRTEDCSMCNKRFCTRSELKVHMRKHTGEKPYICTECGQAFVQHCHLVDHMASHSDICAYKCTHCKKTFKLNSTLKKHIQIHLGHRRFKCSECTYSSWYPHKLTEHMKKHLEVTPSPDCP